MKGLSMKLSKLLLVAFATVAISAAASVDFKQYLGAVVPKAEAKAVLEKVFMHDMSVLDKVDVEVADMQERANGVKVVFFYVGRMSTQYNTELYALSFDSGWKVIDGMLLGYSGDGQVLKLDLPDGYYYETSADLPYSIVGDTLTVERAYRYGTSKQGLKYFNQLGTVSSSYLIGPKGMFTQMPVTSKATESHGEVDGMPTSGEVEGLISVFGKQVLGMAHRPVSAGVDMKAMSEMAKDALEIMESADDDPVVGSSMKNSAVDFAVWSAAMGLRNADVFLPWVAKDKKKVLLNLISLPLQNGEFFEASWLKSKVKNLKDKKARQWWQKWMAEKGL